MSEKRVETVKQLLDAEEEAKRMIEAARAERDARLKQAAAEAEEQIAKFAADKDAEYEAEKNKYIDSSTTESDQIKQEMSRESDTVRLSALTNKSRVVDMLFNYVTNVNVDSV